MKRYFLACLFLAVNAFGLESLKIETGRYVAIENNVLNVKNPTFIFLPGINRGLDGRDEFMKIAQKAKISFVSMHFSAHPESIMMIPKNETPYFKFHKLSAADLADEVLAVIKAYKIAKPIIVGLSYSSIVTSELAALKKFPLIIETAPMMHPDESDPSTGATTGFWRDYLAAIPFTGPFWRDVFLQNIYTQYWSQQIDGMMENYPKAQGNATLRSNFIDGYAALSIAADGFDFSEQEFNIESKRFFILGENELPARYELQKNAIAIYQKQTGLKETSVLLPGAGHIIPSDAPKAYLVMIKESLKLYDAFTK